VPTGFPRHPSVILPRRFGVAQQLRGRHPQRLGDPSRLSSARFRSPLSTLPTKVRWRLRFWPRASWVRFIASRRPCTRSPSRCRNCLSSRFILACQHPASPSRERRCGTSRNSPSAYSTPATPRPRLLPADVPEVGGGPLLDLGCSQKRVEVGLVGQELPPLPPPSQPEVRQPLFGARLVDQAGREPLPFGRLLDRHPRHPITPFPETDTGNLRFLPSDSLSTGMI